MFWSFVTTSQDTSWCMWLWIRLQKTVARFLWQGYISILRALAKLLSDQGANFESNIISELCELMDVQKARTSSYQSQTNGQVEQAHQMLMQMIGELGKDWQADWPKYLPELVHAYNSIKSPIMGYSSHCLMFGWWLCLPIVSTEKHHSVNHCIADLCEQLHEAFKEAQAQSISETERQRWYYDCTTNAILLEPGNLVLAIADTYKERRKVKDQWEETTYEVECKIAEGVTSYLVKNQQTKCSWVLHWNWFLLITPRIESSFMFRCMSWADKVHHHHARGAYLESEWEWGSTTKCKVSAAGPALDRWDSSRMDQLEVLHIPENIF